MNCVNCGALARPGANFCTKCGSRLSPPPGLSDSPDAQPSSLSSVYGNLISELDSARQGWRLSLVSAGSSSSNDVVSIVNPEFSEEIDIGTLGDDKPEIFIFESLNGASAEATTIAWQVESAIGFAVSQKYINEDCGKEFLSGLAQATEALSPRAHFRWLLAMQLVLASFQRGGLIDKEDVAVVLSHYFMNERRRSLGVVRLQQRLLNVGILVLQAFTYIGTSRTFGDLETTARIPGMFGIS